MCTTGCPPLWEVLSYLFLIVFSFAMIGYILVWLSFWKLSTIPLDTLIFFIGFCAIIVFCCLSVRMQLIARLCRRASDMSG